MYVPRIYAYIFLSGRRPCWLRLSRHWSSFWVGGTLCCPSLGSVISERRWCLSGWPLDSTDTGWTLWQVREIFNKLFTLFISLLSCFLLSLLFDSLLLLIVPFHAVVSSALMLCFIGPIRGCCESLRYLLCLSWWMCEHLCCCDTSQKKNSFEKWTGLYLDVLISQTTGSDFCLLLSQKEEITYFKI